MKSDTAISILESLPHVVLLAVHKHDPVTGHADFYIEYVNQEWERLAGSERSTIIGKYISQTIYKNSGVSWTELGEEAIRLSRTVNRTFYSDLLNKWLEVTISSLEYPECCIYIRDISESWNNEQRLKEQNRRLSSLSHELTSSKTNLRTKLGKIEALNSELEKMAYYDPLTDLPNRARFSVIVRDELESARRAEKWMVLALLDIDNLKHINDSLGHDVGDELIRQMAGRLKNYEQYKISAGRFGGDEFLLILKDCDQHLYLTQLVRSLQELLSAPYKINDTDLHATVSMGVSCYPDDADNPADLIKYADIASSEAKKRGKNTIVLFHSTMREKLFQHVLLEKKLIGALQDQLFTLAYQPQIDLSSGSIRGFEALIRWTDLEIGKINPERFIPLAEENRMIIPIGRWIMQEACKTLRQWTDEYGFNGMMSINVSPVQLRHPRFIEDLFSAITTAGVHPSCVEIEITEGVLIQDFDDSIRILNEITQLGIGIALDDFGTGYSSLSYLHHLPLTTLKIDRSFIANMADNQGIEYDIIEAIVSLVNKLGIDTIAEGVETAEQLESIRKLQCKIVQGFYTGRPLTPQSAEKLLAEQLPATQTALSFGDGQ